jgi:hypothetical protein
MLIPLEKLSKMVNEMDKGRGMKHPSAFFALDSFEKSIP